jgi:hypothetical protein
LPGQVRELAEIALQGAGQHLVEPAGAAGAPVVHGEVLDQAAEQLMPYLEAGAEHITLIPAATSAEAGVEHAAAVRALLGARVAAEPG